jgi:condensin-2 complex subunit D3
MRDAGKIMLHKEKLAKKYVAVLARELETCEDPVIRNNVVVVMCDLCVRYCTGQGKLWPVSASAVRRTMWT